MKKIIATIILSLISTLSFADGHSNANGFAITIKVPASDVAKVEAMLVSHYNWMKAVSYTHLTLPTIYSV